MRQEVLAGAGVEQRVAPGDLQHRAFCILPVSSARPIVYVQQELKRMVPIRGRLR